MAKHRIRWVPIQLKHLRGLVEVYANNPDTDYVIFVCRTYKAGDCPYKPVVPVEKNEVPMD